MAQVKVRKAKISELIQDDRNLNKGTARGKELIQKSIGQFGAVRGVAVMLAALVLLALTIPVDIIAGNYLNAAICVLWVFIGIRAYAVHERATESAADAAEIIEAQDQLIDKLKEVMSVMATRQLEADKNNEKVSES